MSKKLVVKINENIVMIQIMILSFLIVNSNIHLPCLPAIQVYYHTSEYMVQLSFIMNAFVAMVISLFYGAAVDFYGRKPILLFSLSLFLLGTLTVIYAETIYLFFLGRLFQSLGDAGGAVTCSVIMADFYKGKVYARIQAILSIVLSLAWAGSPILGGRIFSLFGWKGNFVLVLILSVLMIAPVFFWQERKRVKKHKNPLIRDFPKSIKVIYAKFDSDFVVLSLLQALPLGLFTAFELMLPFIYKRDYGYRIQDLSIAFFIFILINILGSCVYMFFIKRASIKDMFRIASYTILLYFIFGVYFFSIYQSSSEINVYLIYGLLSFSLPFMVISSSTKIIDSYAQHMGIALSLLAIIRNAGTTFIPLLACVLSQNSFHSLFNITLLPTLLTAGLLIRILRRK